MIVLSDKILIKASPEKIFDALCFVFQSTENYKKWNKDHILCRWEKGKDFENGSILYAEELIQNKVHKLKFIITETKKSNGFKYKVFFPFSLICKEGAFIITSNSESESLLDAQLSFKMGSIISVFFRKQKESIMNHMKEEGIELKKIVEKKKI